MNASFGGISACVCLLSLACAARASEERSSTLVPSRCRHPSASPPTAAMTVIVEPPRARNQYLQVTVFAVRSREPDSLVAHAVEGVDALPALSPGLYRLRVRSLGYQTASDTIRVGPGEAWCVTARLAAARALPPAPMP